MNFDNAIAAHAAWKTKFRNAIVGKTAIDASVVSKDNCCELGKWLYSEGENNYGSVVQFKTLIEKHKKFHSEAGKVANLINSKKFSEAEALINAGTAYSAASTDTVIAITRLEKYIVLSA